MSLTKRNGLKISSKLFDFINNEVIPGTNIKSDEFWESFAIAVDELAPINKSLIKKREDIQKKIDEWHKQKRGLELDKEEYKKFLKSISYIVEEKEDFKIETSNVDREISSIAGPQLVVPVDNARYALNAANARWGSLYDSLYGTDVISGDISKTWSKERANKVIDYVVQNGYVENMSELMKPPFDKPVMFIKLFDSSRQKKIVELINSFKENAEKVLA